MDQPDVQPADLAFTMSVEIGTRWVTRAEAICLFRRCILLQASTSPTSPFGLCRGNFRFAKVGGADRDRTDDLMLAKHALSQLSYGPKVCEPGSDQVVGPERVERSTSRLSGVRSNHLSYEPNERCLNHAAIPRSSAARVRRKEGKRRRRQVCRLSIDCRVTV